MLKKLVAASLLMLCTGSVFSQKNRLKVCDDSSLHAELVMHNKRLEDRGFKLVQFETFNAPSDAIIPFYVTMEAGKMYQISYYANSEARKYSLVLLGKDREKLIDLKRKPATTAERLVTQSFTAPYSGTYAIVVNQKLKDKKEACSGLSVMKAAGQ